MKAVHAGVYDPSEYKKDVKVNRRKEIYKDGDTIGGVIEKRVRYNKIKKESYYMVNFECIDSKCNNIEHVKGKTKPRVMKKINRIVKDDR